MAQTADRPVRELPAALRTPEGIPDLALLVPEEASALSTLTAAEQVRAMTGMGSGRQDGVEVTIPATARYDCGGLVPVSWRTELSAR
ncbi:hypothetical protein [Streptomyces sp. NPDC058279]|uniref:hypothetical protein n=1 Tax=Streptomyces sp. NPDC058279 TaxID=3346418 RepID=UPI0036E41187